MKIKKCVTCGAQFEIVSEDILFYEKLRISAPNDCPVCVWENLMAHWNFGIFRKTVSALSGKSIITVLPETVAYPIYSFDEWVSDGWDPLRYGREYDATRPFFEQLKELQSNVPHPHQSGMHNTDCEWSDDMWSCKNCYLCRSAEKCEDLSYGYRNVRCKNSLDLTFCFDTEASYGCTYCFKCFKVFHSFDARDCMESTFLYDCRNCQHCFLCWNLRNKQYCILNEQLTKEEYARRMASYVTHSFAAMEELGRRYEELVAKRAIHRANYNVKTVNSTGNFLDGCKNCSDCYYLQGSEDSRHIFRGWNNRDSIHCAGSIVERSAMSVMDGFGYDLLGTSHTGNCRYSAYLEYCEECEYCFGCVGLRKKQYCILNKQYGKEEYGAAVVRIIEKMKEEGSWGMPLPYDMAPGGYNLSTAQFYFPETKERILARGGLWDDLKEIAKEGIPAAELPDLIDNAPDTISKQAVICPYTNRRYNIASHELQFLREMRLPLPRAFPDYRTIVRSKRINVGRPERGVCAFCGTAIEHFYPKEWGYNNIACINCYQERVL